MNVEEFSSLTGLSHLTLRLTVPAFSLCCQEQKERHAFSFSFPLQYMQDPHVLLVEDMVGVELSLCQHQASAGRSGILQG